MDEFGRPKLGRWVKDDASGAERGFDDGLTTSRGTDTYPKKTFIRHVGPGDLPRQ